VDRIKSQETNDMIMKRFFSAAVFIFSALAAMGQGFHVGLTTGFNSTINLDKGLSDDPRYNSDYTIASTPIGLNVGYDFTPSFGLTLESILANQQMVYELIDIADQIKGGQEIDLQYLHLPLMMRFMNSGDSRTRFNASIGPQLSVLTGAVETFYAEAGDYKMPADASFTDILATYPSATQTVEQAQNGEYTLPTNISETELLSKSTNDFRELEFQIAGAMGVNIDLGKHLVLSTLLRVNYRISELTNEEAVEMFLENNASQLFAEQAQLTLGLQLGIHYSFGINRSYKE
jgi:hypothetical protein